MSKFEIRNKQQTANGEQQTANSKRQTANERLTAERQTSSERQDGAGRGAIRTEGREAIRPRPALVARTRHSHSSLPNGEGRYGHGRHSHSSLPIGGLIG